MTGRTILMILLLALIVGINAQDTTDPATGWISFEGSINRIGHRVFIQGQGSSYQLFLLPQRALDSLQIELIQDEKLAVAGIVLGPGILVYQIFKAEVVTQLRDSEGKPVIFVPGGVEVAPSRCIGCKLCVSQCPVGAISFVQRKAVIDPAKCIECYICEEGKPGGFKGCPVGAIKGK